MSGPPFNTSHSRPRRCTVNLLLPLLAGVESNPGPQRQFCLGVLNAGCATNKAADIADLFADHHPDAMAVCETWIGDTVPDAVKFGLAPMGFNINHVHRLIVSGGSTRGGGLAFISASDILVRPYPLQSIAPPASFERQLLNVRLGHDVIVVANI